MARKPTCLKCKSGDVIPIVYGFPTPQTQEKALLGEVVLGGCVVRRGNPRWHCKNCGHRWRRWLRDMFW